MSTWALSLLSVVVSLVSLVGIATLALSPERLRRTVKGPSQHSR